VDWDDILYDLQSPCRKLQSAIAMELVRKSVSGARTALFLLFVQLFSRLTT
jgi:hypothetical protein